MSKCFLLGMFILLLNERFKFIDYNRKFLTFLIHLLFSNSYDVFVLLKRSIKTKNYNMIIDVVYRSTLLLFNFSHVKTTMQIIIKYIPVASASLLPRTCNFTLFDFEKSKMINLLCVKIIVHHHCNAMHRRLTPFKFPV